MSGFACRPVAIGALCLAALTVGAGAVAVGPSALDPAEQDKGTQETVVHTTGGQEMKGRGPIYRRDGPAYGVYDPAHDFRNDGYVAIESFYFPWEGGDLGWLRDIDGYAAERNRLLMITLEPFSWTAPQQEEPRRLRQGIVSGRYDSTIDSICGEIGRMKSQVWIRWGHEMEGSNSRYPWAGWWPSNYVDAYRHVVTRCRMTAPEAKFVWSPRGEARMRAYFPGSDYVDIVGASLYGLQGYQRLTRGQDTDFVQSFRPLYNRLAVYGLPVIIAEVGYSGSADYVQRWSEQIMWPNPSFPLLKAVVYFNAKETGQWPLGFGKPDWRVYANIEDGLDH